MNIKVIQPKEFMEELVLLFLLFVKGVIVATTTVIYSVIYTLYFILQWSFLGARHIHNHVAGWMPSVPPIFQLEKFHKTEFTVPLAVDRILWRGYDVRKDGIEKMMEAGE